MEADWEIEVGGDAPVIDASWPGFVDLRKFPERASEILEIAELSELGEALIRLNSVPSPVWTAKCDVWPLEQFDRYELDAEDADSARARACYLDLLPQHNQEWSTPATAVEVCKALCARLRQVPLKCVRLDVVVRRAWIQQDQVDHGITAYLAACGATQLDAAERLGKLLAIFADSLCGQAVPPSTGSKLQ